MVMAKIVVLIFVFSAAYGSICPHKKHVVCNRDVEEHKCVCGVAEKAEVGRFEIATKCQNNISKRLLRSLGLFKIFLRFAIRFSEPCASPILHPTIGYQR